MASEIKDSTAGNPTLGKYVNDDQNTTSANTPDHALLNALQDLIVRVMDPMQKTDKKQMPLGPEAEKLITAFQEFISSIVVRSQSRTQNMLEVSLDEDVKVDDDGKGVEVDGDGEDNELSSEGTPLPMISSSEWCGNTIENTNSGGLDLSKKARPIFEEKLLRALREHVFNKMPIRLLCFEPHGSSLQIVLLERGAVFARLTSVVQERIHEDEFRPKSSNETETDEKAIERLISKYAGYAILSHTWLRTTPGEVTYSDWKKGPLNSENPGYRKLVNFCKTAWKDHRLSFGWMDTICIDKESSSELDESIRSMYNWYSRAAICIIYLADTATLTDMHLDPWFTRGWTLQELLAPSVLKFYNAHWNRLVDSVDNDREHTGILDQIGQATSISKAELDNIRGAPISRRMQLAATREVTREEDTAYSLTGIFDVNISIAYGEGAPRAFSRLIQAILVVSTYNILDILNWAGELPSLQQYNSNVLPSSPRSYTRRSSEKDLVFPVPSEPLTLTQMGLRVPVILMPGISISDWETSSRHYLIGGYDATVDYRQSTGFFEKGSALPALYYVLDHRTSIGSDGWTADHARYQLTFAVFNFGGFSNLILLPKTCIAIPLKCLGRQGHMEVTNIGGHVRIQTSEPIVFKLNGRPGSAETAEGGFWAIRPDDLANHGMRLMNLYL